LSLFCVIGGELFREGIGVAKRKPKEYKVVVIEETDVSDEELLERYERYKDLLYSLLFKGEFRKSK